VLETVDQTLRIGIPRALYYYSYPNLWETFFREIGTTPVVSQRSTQRSVEIGSTISEAEHCLPAKLFDAHLSELVDDVDMVFVPRIISTLKGHLSCPKLGPLPDAAQADVARDAKVLSVDIDENAKPLHKTLEEIGRQLRVPRRKARAAAKVAIDAMDKARTHRTRLRKAKQSNADTLPPFLVLGHPYTLHERFLTGPILRKMQSLGADVEVVSFAGKDVQPDLIRWGTSNKMFNRIQALEPEERAGVIQITTFNCGCDSMMIELFRATLLEKKIPYLVIVLDEHTAAAGIETRLEAFVDSLAW